MTIHRKLNFLIIGEVEFWVLKKIMLLYSLFKQFFDFICIEFLKHISFYFESG